MEYTAHVPAAAKASATPMSPACPSPPSATRPPDAPLAKLTRHTPAMATAKPTKNGARRRSFSTTADATPVNSGAAATTTPTMEAVVNVSAMFSSR